MADSGKKPSIPAWQRVPLQAAPEDKPAAASTTEYRSKPTASEPVEIVPTIPSAPQMTQEPSGAWSTPTATPKSAPANEPPIAPVSDTSVERLSTSEFQTYKQQHLVPRAAPVQPAAVPAPPIITYPEFLVQAHQAPPLITPARIANAFYFAGGVAALLYGAKHLLVDPMIESLTEARHDMYMHSQSKVEELNERLAKLVSKAAESSSSKAGAIPDLVADDSFSEFSEPTELFQRSTGTQTTPAESMASSVLSEDEDSSVQTTADGTAWHMKTLDSLKGHLQGLLKDYEGNAKTKKESQESVNTLRHYLDTLTYPTSAVNLWPGGDDATKSNTRGSTEDAIEELKKEIRGVKGVLLSAKRFPAAGRSVSSAA